MVTAQTLNNISQQLNIYCGSFMLVFGIIGALWNILIFRHHSLRLNPHCIYMSIGSISSIIHIFFSLSDRIIDKGFKVEWTANNIAWCKIRYYIAHCTSVIALSCFVLSAIDRFFSTCRQIKWRHLRSVRNARQVCLYSIIFWMLVTIPNIIYIKPIQLGSYKRLCANTSVVWSQIMNYFFHLCCYGIFPWFLMSLFGCLTLKKIRLVRNRRIGTSSTVVQSRMTRLDHQIASMLFVQTAICIISSIPFTIQNIYSNLTENVHKDDYRLAQEYLFLQASRLIFHFNYISLFYVNYISSAIFRQLSKQVLINLFKKQDITSNNITVINHQENNDYLVNQNLKRRYP